MLKVHLFFDVVRFAPRSIKVRHALLSQVLAVSLYVAMLLDKTCILYMPDTTRLAVTYLNNFLSDTL
jgi:hypothetical protein